MRRLTAFLSSVRRGLEEERDNLPALIRAIGHECKRFEDYTAQPVPSREACLGGVDDADVYLLLLGGRYGEPVFDTGLSPTEEEFTRARQRGIPMLVFVKRGVEVEPRQQAFMDRVEEYTVSMWGPVLLGFLTRTAMDAPGCWCREAPRLPDPHADRQAARVVFPRIRRWPGSTRRGARLVDGVT